MTKSKNYSKVCYSSNFLKEVILRIDFPAPVLSLEKTLPNKLSKAALTRFPIRESQKVQAQELQFSATGISANSREETQWAFFGKEREKNVVIAPQHLVLSVRSYNTFEELTGDFFAIVDVLKMIEPELVISRMGLRYINIIDLPNGNPLDWDEHIDGSLLGMINFNGKQDNLSRAFHVLEYKFDDTNLKCQFGIANPDYPAVIKRRQFVLDIDAYSTAAYEVNDLRKTIGDAHELIQNFFESSISEQTRKLMKSLKHERKTK